MNFRHLENCSSGQSKHAEPADMQGTVRAGAAGLSLVRRGSWAIAEAGATTARGSTWTAAGVQRVLRRLPARHK
jgi:hypothetical protein